MYTIRKRQGRYRVCEVIRVEDDHVVYNPVPLHSSEIARWNWTRDMTMFSSLEKAYKIANELNRIVDSYAEPIRELEHKLVDLSLQKKEDLRKAYEQT